MRNINGTVITYQLSAFNHVQIKVYDLLGREIKTIVNSEKLKDRYQISWNGNYKAGNFVTSGAYFFRLIAGGYSSTKKILLLK